MLITVLLASIAAALVALNGYASIRLLKSDFFESNQKAAQLVLIWVLPLLGTLLVLRVMTDEPVTHKEHFEQFEQSDRIGINGESTPWSGHHDPSL